MSLGTKGGRPRNLIGSGFSVLLGNRLGKVSILGRVEIGTGRVYLVYTGLDNVQVVVAGSRIRCRRHGFNKLQSNEPEGETADADACFCLRLPVGLSLLGWKQVVNGEWPECSKLSPLGEISGFLQNVRVFNRPQSSFLIG